MSLQYVLCTDHLSAANCLPEKNLRTHGSVMTEFDAPLSMIISMCSQAHCETALILSVCSNSTQKSRSLQCRYLIPPITFLRVPALLLATSVNFDLRPLALRLVLTLQTILCKLCCSFLCISSFTTVLIYMLAVPSSHCSVSCCSA